MNGSTAGRWACALTATSVTLVAGVAVAGRSAAVPPMRGPGALPLTLDLRPSTALVVVLLVLATGTGAAGVLTGWYAVGHGWRPDPRRLLAAGAVAAGVLAFLPPVGSADPVAYAAYGHLAAVGTNPYATRPADVDDPVARAVEPPWRRVTSVYGPLATAEQRLVAQIAGASSRRIVWLLGLVNAGAFVAAGWLLHRIAAASAERQRRAALLWSLNPLLLQVGVAGGHLDVIATCLAVASIAVTARSRLGAGALGGAAAAVKLPIGAVVAGVCWAVATGKLATSRRRRWSRALAPAVAAVAVLAMAYLLAGPAALRQARRGAQYVALATPWRLVTERTDDWWGFDRSRSVIGLLALLLAAILACALAIGLPDRGSALEQRRAARASAVLLIAYTLSAPYVLPWYDVACFAMLAILSASVWDILLVAHMTVLTLAYLPGRAVGIRGTSFGDGAALRVMTDVRTIASPILLSMAVATTVALGILALRCERIARPRSPRR